MRPLREMEPVYVAGIGLHPYQFPNDTPYIHLGLAAVREALADAGLAWREVQSAYVGTAAIGMATGRVMFRHLGSTGLAVTQVENASASGSFAFRQACMEVAAGHSDIVLALGVDKFGDGRRAANKDGLERLSDTATIPAVKFALLGRAYLRQHDLPVEAMAEVAVKNHGNAALNPYAQFRKPRTLEQVMASPKVAGDLTVQQCCPRGDGAAAVIVVSERARKRLAIPAARAVRVLASVANSEGEDSAAEPSVVDMVRASSAQACEHAAVAPRELDLVELHEAFSVEELIYMEAMGLCGPGEAAHFLRRGASRIGGECAVNASGGLLGMGHPLGPTGVGQIAEIVRQLRGEAGPRQHAGARVGMAHMIGLGSVAIAHILARDTGTGAH
jgi:acetyl-CoA acetyltransferase